MMKRIIFTVILVFLSIVKGASQINNLKDLLEISELNVEEMVSELQYTWTLNPPIQDTSEKGFITERHIFSYNRDNHKQILNSCGRMDLSTGRTIWLTNFVSNDKELLNRIIKNLTYQGFELKGKLKSNSMYDDGNRTVSIQTESEYDYKMPKGCYSIYVVVNKRTNGNLNNTLSNPKSVNSVLDKKFFIGKKKFCDGLKTWYYIVTIYEDNISLESYPDLENNSFKNKTKPVEIVKGKIIGNIIKIPRPKNCEDCGDEYETGRFKFENGVLYDANNEGGYNEYNECATKNASNDALANILKDSKSNNADSNNEIISGNASGTGSGAGNGYNLNGRKAIVKPVPEYKCNEEGKVVVQIVVDSKGNTIEAKTGVKGTTNMSKCLLDACQESALKTKWQPDENAPEKQTGIINYNFRMN